MTILNVGIKRKNKLIFNLNAIAYMTKTRMLIELSVCRLQLHNFLATINFWPKDLMPPKD